MLLAVSGRLNVTQTLISHVTSTATYGFRVNCCWRRVHGKLHGIASELVLEVTHRIGYNKSITWTLVTLGIQCISSKVSKGEWKGHTKSSNIYHRTYLWFQILNLLSTCIVNFAPSSVEAKKSLSQLSFSSVLGSLGR